MTHFPTMSALAAGLLCHVLIGNIAKASDPAEAGSIVVDPFEYVEQLAKQQESVLTPNGGPSLIPTARAIAMFESRIKESPRDFQNRTMLGQLYLRDGKESDNLQSFAEAERVLREAVHIAPEYLPAQIHLATALQARHQFREALGLTLQYLEQKPGDSFGLAVLADSQIELGMYDQVTATFNELQQLSDAPAVMSRVAHFEELTGLSDQALRHMLIATAAVERSGAHASIQAWFQWRTANVYWNRGQLDEAEAGLKKALELEPDYAPAQASLVMVFAGKGRLKEALKLAQHSVMLHGEPPMLATLGDLWALQGDAKQAAGCYDQAEAAMAEEAKVAAAAHLREFAMFLLDHDRKPEAALAMATQDVELRPSVASRDTLAWALHKNSKHEEAVIQIGLAMQLGSEDANFFYHAGRIHEALGDHERAKQLYAKSLSINPGFSLLGAVDARKQLASLTD